MNAGMERKLCGGDLRGVTCHRCVCLEENQRREICHGCVCFWGALCHGCVCFGGDPRSVNCHGVLFVAKLQVIICHECVVCIEIADCDLSQMCGTDIIREDV